MNKDEFLARLEALKAAVDEMHDIAETARSELPGTRESVREDCFLDFALGELEHCSKSVADMIDHLADSCV